MKYFVANFPFNTTEEELQAKFAESVSVIGVRIIKDLESGRSKGFGFVEVEDADADKTLKLQVEINGRKLIIDNAKELKPRHRPRINLFD